MIGATEFAELSDAESVAIVGGVMPAIVIGIIIGVAVGIANEIIKNWQDFKTGIANGMDGK